MKKHNRRKGWLDKLRSWMRRLHQESAPASKHVGRPLTFENDFRSQLPPNR